MKSLSDVYLDQGMRGFIHKTAWKEFWRVANWYEVDDLVQDGYLSYYKCVKAYPQLIVEDPTPDQRRHFMALVRTTFVNHITDLSNKSSRVPEQALSRYSADDGGLAWDEILPAQAEEGSVVTLLASAPAEIKQLVKLLAGDSKALLAFKRNKKGRKAFRETTNEFYCRLLGFDPKYEDVVGRVRAYFGR
jgi:DNA-directed RNA polymerase specialized sigma24 family protein